MTGDPSTDKGQVHVRLLHRSTSQKIPKWREGTARGELAQSHLRMPVLLMPCPFLGTRVKEALVHP